MTGRSQHQPWLRQWPLSPERQSPGSVHNKPLILVPSSSPSSLGFDLIIHNVDIIGIDGRTLASAAFPANDFSISLRLTLLSIEDKGL
ncbi:hypothetical protein SprV_0602079300 [Sparganum proliferum]